MRRKRKTKGKRTRIKGGRRVEGREAVKRSSKVKMVVKMNCCKYPSTDLEPEAPGKRRSAFAFTTWGQTLLVEKRFLRENSFPRLPDESHPPSSERNQY